MRYPAILATITLIVFGAGFVTPASAQLTPNNNTPAGSGQEASFVFVLQLDDQSLQDLRNGQPLLSKIPDDLRNKVTAVRLEYVRNNNVSAFPPANPNGVSTGQQMGPQIPDLYRNQYPNYGNQTNPANVATGNPGLNNSFPPTNPQTTWNNTNTSPTPPGNNPGGVPIFNPSSSTQPVNSNFSPQGQPAGNQGGQTTLAPRTDIPAWNSPAANSTQNNNSFIPPTGQGTQSQPNAGTPTYIPPGSNSVPPYQPTNDRYNPGTSNPNQVDTAQQNTGFNGYQQNPYSNTNLQPVTPNRNPNDPNYNTAWQNTPTQQQQYEARIGYMQQQINQLTQQNAAAGTRYDSLIAGHQYPVTNTYSTNPNNSGLGQTGLLASIRGNLGNSEQLPVASIPGSNSNDPAVGKLREQASVSAAVEDANRKNAFLFFWLMCSIGLNIYLGWISRGFYVRYRELADDLRETFSTV